ncbi:MAG TPA: branched-chain amino acid ABC transporter permease [Acidimicrobiales bacterium]
MTTANAAMVRQYGDDIRLFRTRALKLSYAALIAAVLLVPFRMSDYQASVAVYAGVAAIGAIGLNLLTGFTGQVSLGHAAFLGAGAYTGAYVGGEWDLPFVVWLPAAAIVGALIGLVVGPFALRLRGNYLAIVTLGLVFVAQYVFESWESVTGGANGTSVTAPVKVGPVDFEKLSIPGKDFTRDQGYFYLVWIIALLVALLAKNLVRSRAGRAMQAVRDRDRAAEAIGVHLARYKVLAFVLSSSLAAVAGALYASYQRFVNPGEFTLVVSITYIAMIVVGGAGMIFGSVLGAIFITAIPRLIEELSAHKSVADFLDSVGMSVASLNQAVFGILIVAFLVFEPRGLAAIWLRIRMYFKTWPFSY